MLSTRIHGILDYAMAAFLIIFPWPAGFSKFTWAPWVMLVLGVGILIYSLLTRYEAGYLGLLSFKSHLWLDALAGVILATSPWLLRFAHHTFVVHVASGLFILLAVVLTRSIAKDAPNPRLSPRSPASQPEEIG